MVLLNIRQHFSGMSVLSSLNLKVMIVFQNQLGSKSWGYSGVRLAKCF